MKRKRPLQESDKKKRKQSNETITSENSIVSNRQYNADRGNDVSEGAAANRVEVMTQNMEESDQRQGMKTNGIMSGVRFSDLAISANILDAIREMGYEFTTQIQAHCIPRLLQGRDVLGAAKTGSGKTLAFVVPALDLVYRAKVTPKQGTVVLMLGPTRELVLQISEVLRDAGKHVSHTFGVIMGGSNRKMEEKKLVVGVNILVATPGRLLDHMEHTQGFVYSNLSMLVLDEADRMLDVGFERELTKIIGLLPKERQTCLFSATQTTKVADLIRMSLKKPVLVEVRDRESATVAGLKQYYLVCDSRERLAILYKLLREKSKIRDESGRGLKMMIFFSSCQSCQFHEDFFRLFDGISTMYGLHGQKKQAKRLEIYNKFCTAKEGILLCTNVAARGLDFPAVDYIIQYDPPDDVREYIHRVGRTARGEAGEGSSLLFLLPEELGFVKLLIDGKVMPKRLECRYKSLVQIQEQLELIIDKTPQLKLNARQAFTKYLLAYNSHALKTIFQIEELDLAGVAKSFALSSPPKVDLPGINGFKKKRKRPQR